MISKDPGMRDIFPQERKEMGSGNDREGGTGATSEKAAAFGGKQLWYGSIIDTVRWQHIFDPIVSQVQINVTYSVKRSEMLKREIIGLLYLILFHIIPGCYILNMSNPL